MEKKSKKRSKFWNIFACIAMRHSPSTSPADVFGSSISPRRHGGRPITVNIIKNNK